MRVSLTFAHFFTLQTFCVLLNVHYGDSKYAVLKKSLQVAVESFCPFYQLPIVM